jgi:type II secretory pathway component PulF
MQHGNHGVLEMSDRTISEERFALALSSQKNLRFVFLNACNSAGVASKVHNTAGTSVIFHEVPISDALAVRLASEFYNCLGSGVALGKALDDANSTVAREARAQKVEFIEAHLINGGPSTQIMDKLDRVFNLMSTQLQDIDTRLASVEDEMKQIYRPTYVNWLLALLVALVVAQVGTAVIDVLMRR